MKYKAIFFDAGGTLLRAHPSVGDVYSEVARRYGMETDPAEINRIFKTEFHRRDDANAELAHSSREGEREFWRSLVRDVFAKLTELKNYDAFFAELYDLFGSAKVWRLYPEALPVLEAIQAKGIVMGIVSNWDTRLLSVCDGLNLNRFFKFILASAEFGHAKPGREIFEEALRRSGVKSGEAVHIGDSLDHDYEGARRAGLGAFFLDRHSRNTPGVSTIKSLDELLPLI